MTLEINLKQEPVGSFDSELGKLNIFPLTLGTQRKLRKLLGESFSKVSPEKFVKSLITEVCFLDDDLLEGKYRPDEHSSILVEDANKLTSEDLENFAKIYIESNEYLFKESKTKTKTNERGNSVLYQELGDIIHPREEGEPSVKYLHRLSIIEEEKQKERFAKLIKPFGTAMTGFSKNLTGSIKNSLLMGDSLRKRMEAIKPIYLRPIEPHFNKIDHTDIIAQQEKNRLKPFENLADKLDELIDSSVQVADFMVETNKLQAGIAEELKSSGDSGVKFSKINIIISCSIVFLTICSLYMACSASIHENDRELSSKKVTEQYVERIAKEISGLNTAILNGQLQTKENTSLFVEEIKRITSSHIQQIDETVSKQNQMIEDLKLKNERNMERIKELENKLKDVEKE